MKISKDLSHRFPYNWNLKDANFTKDKGKVFSCFACGGGSTMGYKLAGFDVIGHNDIDKKMVEVYKINHNPKFSFLESITTFAKRKDLPKELYELDILDGSPPCSSFSMAGNREKDWGKEKVFREGQELQVLDTLFFDFIDLAKELKPKVVIAENVKGLLIGNAINYVREIYNQFDKAGYYCQHFLLDASKMGVPQKRERVFFICLRKDLSNQFLQYVDMFNIQPKIKLEFKESEIPFIDIDEYDIKEDIYSICPSYMKCLKLCKEGNSFSTVHHKGMLHNAYRVNRNKCISTIVAHNDGTAYHYEHNRRLTKNEFCKAGTYPIDYNFGKIRYNYLIGMSVPPVMTAQIATNIYEQWLSKLNQLSQ
jgi:DNA (cytosine-5)-methyltransferase 1